MSISPGTQLGRYEIRAKLGAGGMGEVYLARDTRLERTVALKILPAAVTTDQRRMWRFTQEAKAASSLNHPNIITIFEIEESNATHFIATEFIDGATLRQHLARGPMPPAEALDVAVQTASALAAAHEAGIIHRDIKPENIMLRRDGFAKVLDFGLAKLVEAHTSTIDPEAPTQAQISTEPGMVVGTLTHMSPEQARGLEVDARTDIWSLGCVLYEMLTGRAPFTGATSADIIAAIVKTQPAPLSRFVPDVPARLEEIVAKALEKDREERYQGVKDLLVDLRRLKKRMEFESELERSASRDTFARQPGTSDSIATTVEPKSGATTATDATPAARTTASGGQVARAGKRPGGVVLLALAVLLLSAVFAGYYFVRKTTSKSDDAAAIDSIAVLPFENTSRDPDTEYLSDGLTESIINSLTHVPALRVIARSSVFRYKGKEIDPLAAARELGVRAVLTGRVLQRGDNLTISAELTDVRENKQLWGESYERKVADLISVQREIAREIAGNLRSKLTGAEQAGVTKHYTENPAAYQLYLKGRFYWNKRTSSDLKRSTEYFNQAIEQDPNYALAYAGLADAYVLFFRYSASSPQEAYPKAKEAARRALELDDTLAEAHTALAYALSDYDWDFAESGREFRRAIELNPNYATAHQWYSDSNLVIMGRFDEAIAEMRRAQELDPLSLIVNAELGRAYFNAGQYDKAVEQYRKILEMDQNFPVAHWFLGETYEARGQFAEAIAEYERARQLNGDPRMLAMLGHARAASGHRAEALKLLAQLNEAAKQRYISPYYFAIVHAALGDRDQAFQWLERGYQERISSIPFIKYDHSLDPLRADPRFADLVRRIGLAP